MKSLTNRVRAHAPLIKSSGQSLTRMMPTPCCTSAKSCLRLFCSFLGDQRPAPRHPAGYGRGDCSCCGFWPGAERRVRARLGRSSNRVELNRCGSQIKRDVAATNASVGPRLPFFGSEREQARSEQWGELSPVARDRCAACFCMEGECSWSLGRWDYCGCPILIFPTPPVSSFPFYSTFSHAASLFNPPAPWTPLCLGRSPR